MREGFYTKPSHFFFFYIVYSKLHSSSNTGIVAPSQETKIYFFMTPNETHLLVFGL